MKSLYSTENILIKPYCIFNITELINLRESKQLKTNRVRFMINIDYALKS